MLMRDILLIMRTFPNRNGFMALYFLQFEENIVVNTPFQWASDTNTVLKKLLFTLT